MNIITRNFIRLLKCGVFGYMEQLEPMSNFKWLKLIHLSVIQECMGLTYDGMMRYVNARHLILSSKVREEWTEIIEKCENDALKMNNCIVEMYSEFMQSQRLFYPVLLRGRGMSLLYPNPLHYYCSHIDWYIPTEEKAREADAWAKRSAQITSDVDLNNIKYQFMGVDVENNHYAQELMNRKLNKDLQTLVIREKSYYKPNYIQINSFNIEILPPTINLLVLILNLIQQILDDDVHQQDLLDLGLFMRKVGKDVDYIKIERWLNELQMQQLADFEGGLLIKLFGFSKDELPFMKDIYDNEVDNLIQNIFSDENMSTDIDDLSIGRKTKRGMKHLYHSATNLKYHPKEVTGGVLSKFKNIFSQIEE